jgi:hypothetical protein
LRGFDVIEFDALELGNESEVGESELHHGNGVDEAENHGCAIPNDFEVKIH